MTVREPPEKSHTSRTEPESSGPLLVEPLLARPWSLLPLLQAADEVAGPLDSGADFGRSMTGRRRFRRLRAFVAPLPFARSGSGLRAIIMSILEDASLRTVRAASMSRPRSEEPLTLMISSFTWNLPSLQY